ncbi:MAG: hypothetical protein MHM6MM_000437 [Cercozoa sp. M6MM]
MASRRGDLSFADQVRERMRQKGHVYSSRKKKERLTLQRGEMQQGLISQQARTRLRQHSAHSTARSVRRAQQHLPLTVYFSQPPRARSSVIDLTETPRKRRRLMIDLNDSDGNACIDGDNYIDSDNYIDDDNDGDSNNDGDDESNNDDDAFNNAGDTSEICNEPPEVAVDYSEMPPLEQVLPPHTQVALAHLDVCLQLLPSQGLRDLRKRMAKRAVDDADDTNIYIHTDTHADMYTDVHTDVHTDSNNDNTSDVNFPNDGVVLHFDLLSDSAKEVEESITCGSASLEGTPAIAFRCSLATAVALHYCDNQEDARNVLKLLHEALVSLDKLRPFKADKLEVLSAVRILTACSVLVAMAIPVTEEDNVYACLLIVMRASRMCDFTACATVVRTILEEHEHSDVEIEFPSDHDEDDMNVSDPEDYSEDDTLDHAAHVLHMRRLVAVLLPSVLPLQDSAFAQRLRHFLLPIGTPHEHLCAEITAKARNWASKF